MEQNCNCNDCQCNQNSNNGTSPIEIGEFVKQISACVIALKNANILEEETIEYANDVACTLLFKLEEIFKHIDAQKVSFNMTNNQQNNNQPTSVQPMPPMPVQS